MRRLAAVLLVLAACKPGRAYDPVVAELGGLPVDAGLEAFVRHRAMDELLSAMDDALPALERGLGSSDAAIRARCLYVLQANHLSRAVKSEPRLHQDKDPRVRVLVGSSRANCAYDLPADLKGLSDRLPRYPGNESVTWLPPELQARRLDRAFELIRHPRPVEELNDGFGGSRYLPLPEAGYFVILRAMDGNPRVHDLVDRVHDELRATPAEQEGRLALLYDLTLYLLGHPEPDDADCPRRAADVAFLFGLLKTQLPTARDLAMLENGMHLLYDLAEGDAGALAFLRSLAETQATAEGRAGAASWVAAYERNRKRP